jgi:hypothetical protein
MLDTVVARGGARKGGGGAGSHCRRVWLTRFTPHAAPQPAELVTPQPAELATAELVTPQPAELVTAVLARDCARTECGPLADTPILLPSCRVLFGVPRFRPLPLRGVPPLLLPRLPPPLPPPPPPAGSMRTGTGSFISKPIRKRSFFEFSLYLSRACLGKMIISRY